MIKLLFIATTLLFYVIDMLPLILPAISVYN
jgi:hypothetical protein